MRLLVVASVAVIAMALWFVLSHRDPVTRPAAKELSVENGMVRIKREWLIRLKPQFFEAAVRGETPIRLLAVIDENGRIRVALDRCRPCAGSHFVQGKRGLTCSVCGRDAELSAARAGEKCAPVALPLTAGADEVTINESDFAPAASRPK